MMLGNSQTTPQQTAPSPARVEILASGTGSVTIAGRTVPLRGGDVNDARRQAQELLVKAAQDSGSPVLTVSREPSGTWWMSVQPDGTVVAADAPRPTAVAAVAEPPATPAQPVAVAASLDPAPAVNRPVSLVGTPTPVPAPPTPVEQPKAPRPATPPTQVPSHSAPTPPAPVQEPPATYGHEAPPASQAPAPVISQEPTAPTHQESREQARQTSLLRTITTELPARHGWRGAANLLGLHLAPSAAERSARADIEAVSQHWPGPRTIAVVNGKGGSGKTPATVLLSATFARNGGAGVIAWDNNPTRGTLGWRTLQGPHDSSVENLLPHVEHLLSPAAQAAELAAFVHHQPGDRFDVLRSRPEVLAEAQWLGPHGFTNVHDVLRKYYRLVLIDSGNDESHPSWRAMVYRADAIVVPTTTRPEHAESARLLLDELARTDAHCARLAENALVIVSQASKAEPGPDELVAAFRNITRAATGIPYDVGMAGRPLLLDSLAPQTQRAWLAATAALAAGLH